jgi:hypothetical protein
MDRAFRLENERHQYSNEEVAVLRNDICTLLDRDYQPSFFKAKPIPPSGFNLPTSAWGQGSETSSSSAEYAAQENAKRNLINARVAVKDLNSEIQREYTQELRQWKCERAGVNKWFERVLKAVVILEGIVGRYDSSYVSVVNMVEVARLNAIGDYEALGEIAQKFAGR